ncbi:MAG: putative aspartyl/glutamyl-tRNA(Asn/Gln) amidotransferase subunit [Candidatus Parcubacteria bacterium]|jgi:aspartyl/glutamyl-tRNA(Asn/Gln) amidotransferase C subunit
MSFTKEDLATISSLARIVVTQEEEEKMLADMQAILGYVSEINEVGGAVERVKPVSYNVVREDVVTYESGSHTDALLREAPATEDGYVKVAQVLK